MLFRAISCYMQAFEACVFIGAILIAVKFVAVVFFAFCQI